MPRYSLLPTGPVPFLYLTLNPRISGNQRDWCYFQNKSWCLWWCSRGFPRRDALCWARRPFLHPRLWGPLQGGGQGPGQRPGDKAWCWALALARAGAWVPRSIKCATSIPWNPIQQYKGRKFWNMPQYGWASKHVKCKELDTKNIHCMILLIRNIQKSQIYRPGERSSVCSGLEWEQRLNCKWAQGRFLGQKCSKSGLWDGCTTPNINTKCKWLVLLL